VARAAARRVRREPGTDLNLAVAGWLLDLAAVQPAERQRHAYTRAAYAVLGLPRAIDSLIVDGGLEKIRYIGPSSTRVILEVVRTGGSDTVRAAIEASGRASEVERRRPLRTSFISQAAAEAALEEPLPARIVSLERYRGDFQLHSTFSDGGQTLEQIIETGLALGHTVAAVTDHSYGLPVARGMSMEAAARQHAEIDRLNAAYDGRFRLLKGIEANIRADGSLDMQDDELRQFDLVVGAPHSALRSSSDQTGRMVAAVQQRRLDILGHPRGRRFNTRPGVLADWPRVFAEAARNGVAIEIDGYVDRQDIDYALAAEALAAGCNFALDSDAHSPQERLFTRMAVAHARLAGIPADRVVNCWSDRAIAEWATRFE
jgi:histidinol phosphatase-like PHP family hydrolase